MVAAPLRVWTVVVLDDEHAASAAPAASARARSRAFIPAHFRLRTENPLPPAGVVDGMTVKAQFPDEQTHGGQFVRQADVFREWVRADGSSAYPAVAGRYHLYVSLACPWAHRTIVVR